MDAPDDLPPLTFAVPVPRLSQKKQVSPSIVPLAVTPIHFSAIGFIATALAKQIMHARGRINQAFPELESRVKSEIQCVIDSRREEMARDSIDDRSAPEQEDLSVFPVRLPLDLNKCNRLLSLFQTVFADLENMFLSAPVSAVVFVFGSSVINPSELLELIVDPTASSAPAAVEAPALTGARIMRLISRSLVSSHASIFSGEAKPARMFTMVRLEVLPVGYEDQDRWREEPNFRARCKKGSWLKVVLASSVAAAANHDVHHSGVWLRHSIVCKPLVHLPDF